MPRITRARVRTVSVGLRMPVGLYDAMVETMQREGLWARPQPFIFEAINEHVKRLRAARREHEERDRADKAGDEKGLG
jgi:hypothetical protein